MKELKSLSAVYDVLRTNGKLRRMRIPLMSVVDYCGFRISVQSLLPLGLDTLKYGSSDGAVTIHTESKAEGLAREIGKALFLKEHVVEDGRGKKKPIVGPADMV